MTRPLARQWDVAISMLWGDAMRTMRMHSATRVSLATPRRHLMEATMARSSAASSPVASLPGPSVPGWRTARRQPCPQQLQQVNLLKVPLKARRRRHRWPPQPLRTAARACGGFGSFSLSLPSVAAWRCVAVLPPASAVARRKRRNRGQHVSASLLRPWLRLSLSMRSGRSCYPWCRRCWSRTR